MKKIEKVGNMFVIDEYRKDGTFYINRGVFRTLKDAEGKL